MKKLISILVLGTVFSSCGERDDKVKPIEIYRNKGVIVIEEPYDSNSGKGNMYVRCKTKDSVFTIGITDFDAKNLKVGDTL